MLPLMISLYVCSPLCVAKGPMAEVNTILFCNVTVILRALIYWCYQYKVRIFFLFCFDKSFNTSSNSVASEFVVIILCYFVFLGSTFFLAKILFLISLFHHFSFLFWNVRLLRSCIHLSKSLFNLCLYRSFLKVHSSWYWPESF